MSMNKLRRLSMRGDTIVEVMIVLAVLGLAIGISYATANRSLLNARQAQENSQATELVRSQLEQLRSMSANTNATDTAHYIYVSQPFCIAANGQVTLLPSASCNLGEASRYKVSINWGGAASNDAFTVTATWDDVLGQGSDTVTLVYGVHVPAAAALTLCPTGYSGLYPACVALPPPLSGALSVVVKAIPPAAGNITPSCAAAASQLKSGTTVRLTDNSTGAVVGTKSTDVNSLATFTGIQQGDTFTATVSRSNFGVCPSGSTAVASTTAPVPVISKTIYPRCTTTTTTTYSGYWAYGARHPELDNYYYTIPPAVPSGYYPGAYSSFVAGPPYHWYVWSGDSSRAKEGLLYYYIWDASWVNTSTTTTTHNCPS
jgi:type II secretory pathway pseudopilin PulG